MQYQEQIPPTTDMKVLTKSHESTEEVSLCVTTPILMCPMRESPNCTGQLDVRNPWLEVASQKKILHGGAGGTGKRVFLFFIGNSKQQLRLWAAVSNYPSISNGPS